MVAPLCSEREDMLKLATKYNRGMEKSKGLKLFRYREKRPRKCTGLMKRNT